MFKKLRKKYRLSLSTILISLLSNVQYVTASSGYFVFENTQGNLIFLGILFVIGVMLTFLNFGKIINLFGAFLLFIIGLIIMFNIQTVIGILILVLGLISAFGVEQ
jgi:hypothetical protein